MRQAIVVRILATGVPNHQRMAVDDQIVAFLILNGDDRNVGVEGHHAWAALKPARSQDGENDRE